MYLHYWRLFNSLKTFLRKWISAGVCLLFIAPVGSAYSQEYPTLEEPALLTTQQGNLLCFYLDPAKLDSKVIKPPTSIPRPLGAKDTVKPFGCRRDFQYEGKVYTVDSFNRADGEHLRPYIADIPEAVDHLNLYQENKRNVQNVAYIGTAGLLLALTGIILSKQISANHATSVRNILVFSGGAIMVGSAVYAVNSLISNEENLINAVKSHNMAKPQTPIELQFGATLLF